MSDNRLAAYSYTKEITQLKELLLKAELKASKLEQRVGSLSLDIKAKNFKLGELRAELKKLKAKLKKLKAKATACDGDSMSLDEMESAWLEHEPKLQA